MTAKERLRQIASLDSRIANRLRLVEYYMDKATSLEHALKSIVVQSNSAVSPMEECVVKAIDLARDIQAEIDTLRDERRTVVRDLDALPSGRLKDVLERRYISAPRESWADIAADMGLDEDYVKHLHGWALEAFGRAANKC